jgi:hypothetical protein
LLLTAQRKRGDALPISVPHRRGLQGLLPGARGGVDPRQLCTPRDNCVAQTACPPASRRPAGAPRISSMAWRHSPSGLCAARAAAAPELTRRAGGTGGDLRAAGRDDGLGVPADNGPEDSQRVHHAGVLGGPASTPRRFPAGRARGLRASVDEPTPASRGPRASPRRARLGRRATRFREWRSRRRRSRGSCPGGVRGSSTERTKSSSTSLSRSAPPAPAAARPAWGARGAVDAGRGAGR